MFWERKYVSSSSYSASHRRCDSTSEVYISSDDEPVPSRSYSNKSPSKPARKRQKSASSRDKYTERINLFCCKICNKKYTTMGGLNCHFTRVHEMEKDGKESKKKEIPRSPTPRFRCKHCSKHLTSQKNLERHIDIRSTTGPQHLPK